MSVERHTRPDGTVYWKVRWKQDGRSRRRHFDLKRDADAYDSDLKRRRQLGPLAVTALTAKGPTFRQWVEERWAPEHGATLAPATLDNYESARRVHIAPFFDETPLRDMTVGRLRDWQAARLKAGVSPQTIVKSRTFLSSVLTHAAQAEAIPSNPLRVVRGPRIEPGDEVRPIGPAAVEKIRQALLEPEPVDVPAGTRSGRPRRAYRRRNAQRTGWHRQRDAVLVSVLAYSGVRPGEALALTWAHVQERTLIVNASKTGRRRSVRLLEPLAADLRAWKLASGARALPNAPVIPRDDGEPWGREDWKRWAGTPWRRACAAAAVEPAPRPYDLRHGFASLLIAEGRSVIYVARQLGHSADMTLRVYAHLLDELEDAPRIDAAAEIAKARRSYGALSVPSTGSGHPPAGG